ncbi:hypothetical protein POPTR_016G068650v4 [Populus trichocarpa]|uniref:Uncharacterized protein n=1 Tax=Populus trichocarpa TaxID=3694 RepID=A0ACC0RST9_POPTR|nr:hypothetical protein POPTR_016G068650v4 [Populus trichocarpa]
MCSPISWAHRDGKQGAHLIDWDLQVTLSKSSGRLGYHTSSAPRGASSTWKGIIKGLDMLKEGYCWRDGDGIDEHISLV